MNHTKRFPRVFAFTLGVGLAFSACGGDVQLGGDIASGSSFCSALENFSEVDPDSGDFGEIADGTALLVVTLPPDAPTDLRDMLDATNDVAQMMERTDGDIDPSSLSSTDLAIMQDAMDVFGRVDSAAPNAWMQNTCPDLAAAQGILGGSALGSGFSGSSSQTASSALPTATPEPTATPIPTPTPIPVVAEEVLADGNATSYRNQVIDIGAITRTNGTADTFFSAANEAGDVDRLFIELYAQTDGFGATYRTEQFIVETPDGRIIAASSLYGTSGDRQSQVTLAERDSVDLFVGFELPDGFDTAGATLLYGDGHAPAIFPLSGIDETMYPLDLDTPAAPIEFVGRVEPNCEMEAVYDINSASISLDRYAEFDRLDRVAPGERALNLFGQLMPVGDGCGWLHYSQVNLRLEVDGRPVSGAVHDSDNRNLFPGDTSSFVVSFLLPADATQIELVDEVGNSMVAWDLTLSPRFGEPGYTSPPADPTAVLTTSSD